MMLRAADVEEDQIVADAGGDVWAFIDEKWRYITGHDGFTEWASRDALTDADGPFLALSGSAADGIRKFIPTP